MRRAILVVFGALALAGCTVDPNPANLDFGRVYVNTTKALTAVWTNNSDKAANVLGASTQPPYAMTGNAAGNLAPGAATPPLTITFAPTAAGTFDEEARVVSTGVSSTKIQLTGQGVWAINSGNFVLENQPPNIVGSFDFSTHPIQPNQPIDWGVRPEGGPEVSAFFQVRNRGAQEVNYTASVNLLRGNQNFRIAHPGATQGIHIGAAGPNPVDGTRKIEVTFNPVAVGDYWDIVVVTDSANPANHAGILLKASVRKEG